MGYSVVVVLLLQPLQGFLGHLLGQQNTGCLRHEYPISAVIQQFGESRQTVSQEAPGRLGIAKLQRLQAIETRLQIEGGVGEGFPVLLEGSDGPGEMGREKVAMMSLAVTAGYQTHLSFARPSNELRDLRFLVERRQRVRLPIALLGSPMRV